MEGMAQRPRPAAPWQPLQHFSRGRSTGRSAQLLKARSLLTGVCLPSPSLKFEALELGGGLSSHLAPYSSQRGSAFLTQPTTPTRGDLLQSGETPSSQNPKPCHPRTKGSTPPRPNSPTQERSPPAQAAGLAALLGTRLCHEMLEMLAPILLNTCDTWRGRAVLTNNTGTPWREWDQHVLTQHLAVSP